MFSYNDLIIKYFQDKDPNVKCRNVTFQVTDDCCLKCSYCYQINKDHHMMTIETAKKIVDLLFKMYDEDKPDAFINHHTKAIVLDFIGGEPFMNIDVIDATVEYFIQCCLEREHEWLTNFVISISTNGMLYFDEKVQNFLHKYKSLISMTITIDGPKSIHDACRVDYDGNGSFDKVFKAWKHWLKEIQAINIATKVTIAPENLPMLDTIFDFFLEFGVVELFANPIYEHPWTPEEGGLYYQQLKKLADQLLKYDHRYSSLFDENRGRPLSSRETNNWCGGTGDMLAFDPMGRAYPCLRYMESSLGKNVKPIIIGDANGIYNTPETQAICDELNSITRQSQSTEECLNCHVASGCGWCSAWNYQSLGSVNKRCTNICWMHRAESLANVYYWNNYYRLHESKERFPLYLSRDIATKMISNEEYDYLLDIS